MLTNLQEREVLFIDEVHRMAPAIEEILYPAMEDYELDIMIGQGPGARSVKVPVQPFTLIGATTRTGLLTSPLRARFGIVHAARLLQRTRTSSEIVRRSARILGAPIEPRRAAEIAQPIARHAARRQPPAAAGARLRAGPRRRPHHRRRGRRGARAAARWTSTGSTKSIGGCCGRSSRSSAAVRSASARLAAAISEERDAIEDIYEPFLIQIGFLDRTPRGRVATRARMSIFGLTAPGKDRLW